MNTKAKIIIMKKINNGEDFAYLKDGDITGYIKGTFKHQKTNDEGFQNGYKGYILFNEIEKIFNLVEVEF